MPDGLVARIRRFLVEMDIAKRAEDAGLAVIVYMDENFVHEAHSRFRTFLLTRTEMCRMGLVAQWGGAYYAGSWYTQPRSGVLWQS